MKNLLILIVACLALTILPGCETARRVDQIKDQTKTQLVQHDAAVTAAIVAEVNAWILAEQAAGRAPDTFAISLKTKQVSDARWGEAQGGQIAILEEGARRTAEATKGIWAEISLNAPAAIAQAAAGNPIGAVLALIGATGAAVGVSRKYTAKVVTANDEKREAKYKPGGSHAELEALLKSAPAILAMARSESVPLTVELRESEVFDGAFLQVLRDNAEEIQLILANAGAKQAPTTKGEEA